MFPASLDQRDEETKGKILPEKQLSVLVLVNALGKREVFDSGKFTMLVIVNTNIVEEV